MQTFGPTRPPPTRPVPSSVHRRRRLAVWLLVLANLVVFGSLALALYASARMQTVEVGTLDTGGGPVNFVVVGTDSREHIPEGVDPAFFAGGGGQRADVVMLVHFLGGRAQVLSLPRDLKVEIPGRGTDKLNAAYAHGGPDLLVETVRRTTGLAVHHYLEVDFVGFARIVDALGGVDLCFPYQARDDKSGLAVAAGTCRIDGTTALAYARSRSYQELRDGRWVTVEGDDIGRTGRQQRLVFAMLSEAKEPDTLLRFPLLMEAMGASVTTDQRFGPARLLSVGWQIPLMGSEDVEAVTLPVRPSNEGGISYVLRREPEAGAVLEAFGRGEPMVAVVGGMPSVRVLNGNGVPGAAGRVADLLRQAGFEVAGAADADRQDHSVTLVIAPPAELAKARLVAGRLGFGEVRAGETGGGADVLVIVGLDQAG